MRRFKDINYLLAGNAKQRAAYKTLTGYRIMERLSEYDPVLAGTVPINIDIDSSDLDIICHCADTVSFAGNLEREFSGFGNFTVRYGEKAGYPYAVAGFTAGGFGIEIFGQDIPAPLQNAYRHMLIESAVLEEFGESFRRSVVELKQNGIKTEPAFALLLGLEGDPYEALLEYGEKYL